MADRLRAIESGIAALARRPYRGTLSVEYPPFRFVAVQRAVIWFHVDEPAEVVRVMALFFGGEDHITRMRDRLGGGAAG